MLGGAVGGFVFEHVGPAQLFLGSAAGIAAGIVVVWMATAEHGRP